MISDDEKEAIARVIAEVKRPGGSAQDRLWSFEHLRKIAGTDAPALAISTRLVDSGWLKPVYFVDDTEEVDEKDVDLIGGWFLHPNTGDLHPNSDLTVLFEPVRSKGQAA